MPAAFRDGSRGPAGFENRRRLFDGKTRQRRLFKSAGGDGGNLLPTRNTVGRFCAMPAKIAVRQVRRELVFEQTQCQPIELFLVAAIDSLTDALQDFLIELLRRFQTDSFNPTRA